MNRSMRVSSILFFVLATSVVAVTHMDAHAANVAYVAEAYARLPMSFEANQGQADQRVRFIAYGSGFALCLTNSGAVLSVKNAQGAAALRMNIAGGNPAAKISGLEPLPGRNNYFIGNDPRQWHTNIPTYTAVKYHGVYPGIDLIYRGNQRQLEYDFRLNAGADPRLIELNFQGASKLAVNARGDLIINIAGGELVEHAPVIYQESAVGQQPLPGGYVLRGKGRVGFSVSAYDHSKPLVIDPVLAYSSYIGGGSSYSITVGPALVYIVGSTASFFPLTQKDSPNLGGPGPHAFVASLVLGGSLGYYGPFWYSTLLGGSGTDGAFGVALDAQGDAYVVGTTTSADYPTTAGAFQTFYGGGGDAFVTKLAPNGVLSYSTYLGAGGADQANAVALDAAGDAYLTGSTASHNFPTTPNALKNSCYSCTGGSGGFVTELNPSGSGLVYSTYLGGTGVDQGNGIAADAAGNAYITGVTTSSDFPTTAGAFQTVGPSNGHFAGFVSKLNTASSALVYSTYLGSGGITVSGIAVSASGEAYVTGGAGSGFPITPGAFQTAYGGAGEDGFVTKLNADGSALVYSTYLGGSDQDACSAIAVDRLGNAYVTGFSRSTNFPTTPGAFQNTFKGIYPGHGGNVIVSVLNSTGSALVYSTYLGGSNENGDDEGYGIALDTSGNVYVTGTTNSSDFPTTPNAYQTVYEAGGDPFIAKFTLLPPAGHFQ